MALSGIYKIQSKVKPERIYIGSAININNRWREHLRDLKKGTHHSKKLQRHWNKYGGGDLQFSVLLGCDKEDLIKTEQYFIDSYRPYFNGSMIAGLGCNLGLVMPLETRMKIGATRKRKGYKMSAEHKEKIIKSNLGRKLSEDHKKNIGESNKGKHFDRRGQTLSIEHRKNIGIGNKGRVLSEETRNKISNAHKGMKASNEAKIKMSKSRKGRLGTMKGKCHSEEAKKKMSIAKMGHPVSEDNRRKLSERMMGNKIQKAKLNKKLVI